MPKDIKLKKASRDIFADQDSSWMALDLPEIKPPIYSKAFILFLSTFFVTGVLYSAFTEVPVVMESAGRIVNEKAAIPVRSLSHFTVDRIAVKENQVVKAGAVLVTSVNALPPEDMDLLAGIKRELEVVNSVPLETACTDCEKTLLKAMQLGRKLLSKPKLLQIARPVFDSTKNLAENLYKFNVVNQKLSPMRTRLAALTGSRNIASADAPALTGEALSLQKKIAQQTEPFQTQILKQRVDLKSKTQEFSSLIDDLGKLDSVQAPIDGKIVNIRVKGQGESIGGGQALMEIVPVDSQFVAMIEVPNRDIGSIQPGDGVEVTVDAFPEMDYGHLNGHIEEILAADEGAAPANQERGFRVRVSLKSQSLKMGDQTYALLPGMTLRARVLKKHETLLKTFYRTLFRLKEDIRVRG